MMCSFDAMTMKYGGGGCIGVACWSTQSLNYTKKQKDLIHQILKIFKKQKRVLVSWKGEVMSSLPILLAKDKNAKILKDDYKIGWLVQDEKSWLWIVWGSCKDLDTAIKCAKDTIEKKGDRPVYISDKPLSKDGVQTDNLNIRQLNEIY